MGVDLVPIVRNFYIREETFDQNSHDIADHCVTLGNHRVLRFDFLTHNIGDTDLVVGSPQNRPDLFEYSNAHGHYHLKDFNEFILYDSFGNQATQGYKQAFCLEDSEAISPGASSQPRFSDCNSNQGISAGWADLYNSSLPCQFIVIDGVPDGDYTLVVTTNHRYKIPEDSYENNTICQGLRISGNNVEMIDPPIHINLLTPTLRFNDIPENETTVRAIVFEIRSCRSVNFEIVNGPTVTSGPSGTVFGTPGGTSASVSISHMLSPREARIWISYTGTQNGDVASGSVTVRCVETGNEFTIPINCNTIRRPKAALVLVLDKSNSMNWDAGDGRTRIQVLHDSASPFIDLLPNDSGIGIVSFDQDAYQVMPVTEVGNIFGQGRVNARTNIAAHTPNPNGFTSIGDGVELAHTLLQQTSGYDVKAIIVLTDGLENRPKFIADIRDQINEYVYAIGLGTVEQIQPAALTALTNGTGGYLLMTGVLGTDDYFRLTKYYLQILAGVSNANIVLDPEGWIFPGQEHRIPFQLAETDFESDIILLSPYSRSIYFKLETPKGQIIDPGSIGSNPGISYVVSNGISYYRFHLPLLANNQGSHAGTWYAILSLNNIDPPHIALPDHPHEPMEVGQVVSRGLRYSLNVHAKTNLKMNASLSQTSQEPGAFLIIRVLLTEYDLPVKSNTKVTAELKGPDNLKTTLSFNEVEQGVFETTVQALFPGLYTFRVRANGWTFRGNAFTREQLLTGAVWKGGDSPLPSSDNNPVSSGNNNPPSSSGNGRPNNNCDDLLCKIIHCLCSNDQKPNNQNNENLH